LDCKTHGLVDSLWGERLYEFLESGAYDAGFGNRNIELSAPINF
jgi:hypothetical protein